MWTDRLQSLWNQAWVRATAYVVLVLMCYLFGEYSSPFIYRDF